MLSISSDQSAWAYPIIRRPNLKVEIVAEGITFPTSLAFLANDDILVLEKNTGAVKRVINGIIQPNLLLNLDVANQGERGALALQLPRTITDPPMFFCIILNLALEMM